MTKTSVVRRFLGQTINTKQGLTVRDLFGPDQSPIAVTLTGEKPPEGSYVEIHQQNQTPFQIADVLATPGTARAAVYDLALAHELNPYFPPEVDEEVAKLLTEPQIDAPDIEDLTALPFVTIDSATTRDLDQALFVERQGQDFIAYYALADGAWFVRPGSALFDEALRRGSSYYLPGVVVPMLPRALSEGLISLNPKVDRRALVFRMQIDARGRCRKTELLRARIRSRAKLSFELVQQYYDQPGKNDFDPPTIGASLAALKQLGELRIHEAAQRDVIRYRRSEAEVELAAGEGMRFVVHDELRGPVERYNEQLSLLCNIEGARFLRRGDTPTDHVQPVYRVHPRPEPERFAEFETLLEALAKARGCDRKTWTWQRSGKQSLADFLTGLPATGKHARLARAIHRQAVLLNVRSLFSEQPAEHFGVGADLYARFSAPMREIVGIFVHKEAWEKLSGAPIPLSDTKRPWDMDDDQLRATVVERANQAKQLQKLISKDASRLVLDQLFQRDLAKAEDQRPWRQGTVMGLTRSKAHVMLDDPRIDVKVYARHLRGQLDVEVELSPDAVAYRRTDDSQDVCLLGDAVKLRVHGRDRRRDRWILSLRRPQPR